LSNLNLSVGLGGVGLSISGGSLGIATITAKPATAPATDNRSWSAVTGKDLAITLNIPGIQGSVTTGSVRINRASGQFDPTPANPTSGDEVKAVALNWATAGATPAPLTVDLDGGRCLDGADRAGRPGPPRCRTRRRSRSRSAARSWPWPARSPAWTCFGILRAARTSRLPRSSSTSTSTAARRDQQRPAQRRQPGDVRAVEPQPAARHGHGRAADRPGGTVGIASISAPHRRPGPIRARGPRSSARTWRSR
jgi:hypothetical protein